MRTLVPISIKAEGQYAPHSHRYRVRFEYLCAPLSSGHPFWKVAATVSTKSRPVIPLSGGRLPGCDKSDFSVEMSVLVDVG